MKRILDESRKRPILETTPIEIGVLLCLPRPELELPMIHMELHPLTVQLLLDPEYIIVSFLTHCLFNGKKVSLLEIRELRLEAGHEDNAFGVAIQTELGVEELPAYTFEGGRDVEEGFGIGVPGAEE